MAVKTTMTLREFERLPDDDERRELDEGELITIPPDSDEHGGVASEIHLTLARFVKQHSLGKVYIAETGFVLGSETLRAPDVSFVRKERLSAGYRRAFIQGAPDLAIEVFSPSESVPQLMRKVRQYLAAGAHIVWIFFPEGEQVHVFEASGKDRVLNRDDLLEAPDLLPGFSVPVAAFFT